MWIFRVLVLMFLFKVIERGTYQMAVVIHHVSCDFVCDLVWVCRSDHYSKPSLLNVPCSLQETYTSDNIPLS